MALSIHDVLRALVRQDAAKLNDAQWTAEAYEAIDAHEQAAKPAEQGTTRPPIIIDPEVPVQQEAHP